MHSKVEYIVAHGISSYINDKKVVIGSSHFVFEDEECTIDPQYQDRYDTLPPEYSHLYLAIEHKLAAVICIEDPLREEAAEMVKSLKAAGITKVVMMTGDSERTAAAIAKRVGVDEYYAEVLPEDKANFVEKEKSEGRKVIMIGDGINDSPALSAADVGIAIGDGAEIYGEVENSVIGPGVFIGKGAVVRDSIIMKEASIGAGCVIDRSIIAENVKVGENVVTNVGEDVPNKLKPKVYSFGLTTIGEDSVIPANVKIGKNTAISGETTPEDYPDGVLESGETLIKEGDLA